MSFVDAFSIKIHLIDYWRHLIERKKKNLGCKIVFVITVALSVINLTRLSIYIYIFIYGYLFNVIPRNGYVFNQ